MKSEVRGEEVVDSIFEHTSLLFLYQAQYVHAQMQKKGSVGHMYYFTHLYKRFNQTSWPLFSQFPPSHGIGENKKYSQITGSNNLPFRRITLLRSVPYM